jgi:hypothetical protein
MAFQLKNIKADLDKLTIHDLDIMQAAISKMQ